MTTLRPDAGSLRLTPVPVPFPSVEFRHQRRKRGRPAHAVNAVARADVTPVHYLLTMTASGQAVLRLPVGVRLDVRLSSGVELNDALVTDVRAEPGRPVALTLLLSAAQIHRLDDDLARAELARATTQLRDDLARVRSLRARCRNVGTRG